MASASAAPTHHSLMSIDPSVARQIVFPDAQNAGQDAQQRGTVEQEENKAPKIAGKSTPHSGASIDGKTGKRRKNSLRRVKNSREILREKTVRTRDAEIGTSIASATKEGRNFTVGNVGTGGIIYLRLAAG